MTKSGGPPPYPVAALLSFVLYTNGGYIRLRTIAVEYSEFVPSSPKLIISTNRITSSDVISVLVLPFILLIVFRSCFNTVGGNSISFRKCSSRCGNEQKIGDDIDDRGISTLALLHPIPSTVGPPNTAIRNGGGIFAYANPLL